MTEEESASPKKVTIYFTGKIQVDASLLGPNGVRSDSDVTTGVIDGIESVIHEHLMYSDNDREETDLVQAIDNIHIWDTTAAVHFVSQAVRDFEAEAVKLRDADGDVPHQNMNDYDRLLASHEEQAWETATAFADPDYED